MGGVNAHAQRGNTQLEKTDQFLVRSAALSTITPQYQVQFKLTDFNCFNTSRYFSKAPFFKQPAVNFQQLIPDNISFVVTLNL